METVRIFALAGRRPRLRKRLDEAQQEAARVWTVCRDRPLAARQQRTRWPTRDDRQQATTGPFALHTQRVQMICQASLAHGETARELRQTTRKIRDPSQDKRSYPLLWPAQAVSVERGRIVLPLGRGRPSVRFQGALPAQSGGGQLVWREGDERPVSVPTLSAQDAPGTAQATLDLGEMHQAAVTPTTGAALLIAGRGLRSWKRRHTRALGHLAKKRQRCHNGSRRWRTLQRARRQMSARQTRQIRHLPHQGTRQVITFGQQHGGGSRCIGKPPGVRRRDSGRHHHQRLAQWEYGQARASLTSTAKTASSERFTGAQRGTASQCPVCGWQQQVKGRTWRCRNARCAFVGPRAVVGSVNRHPLAFGTRIDVPAHVTYQRPGPQRVQRRSKEPARVDSNRNVVGARTRATRRASARWDWRCFGERAAQPPLR